MASAWPQICAWNTGALRTYEEGCAAWSRLTKELKLAGQQATVMLR